MSLLKNLIVFIIIAGFAVGRGYAGNPTKLKISENKRFLVKEDGTPFFWLGDTFWDWYKIQPEELDEYLSKRVSQGYTVIQMQAGAYGRANYAGNWCFGGTTHKDITQPQEAFWQHTDLWMEKIREHGLYAAVGLSWIINHWTISESSKISVNDFYNYGKFVGNRYKDFDNIVWLSLNESTYQSAPAEKIEAVCRGIRDGDTGDKLLTLHPLAGTNTSETFNEVVDFNSWQTARFSAPDILPYKYGYSSFPAIKGNCNIWDAIDSDYKKEPVKPVIDLEAWYEEHLDDMPVDSKGIKATAWHVRVRAWFSILAGGFGHTYGAAGLAYNVDVKNASWRQSLKYPGGDDMGHIAKLLNDNNRPVLKMAPAQGMIKDGQSDSYDSHKQAAMANDGSYAYVYTADGSSFTLDLTLLGQGESKINARWFDPREGTFQDIPFQYERVSSQLFTPPGSPSADNDWVLVLEADFASTSQTIKDGANSFICYPNPTNSFLHVERLAGTAENVVLRLYNVQGGKLFSGKGLYNKGPFSIDMRNYPPGVYFLSITSDSGKEAVREKIIKYN